ncbi:MAG: Rab family GTPase [Thermodesulfobacteriota bacterium]|nr:Rab family GTPase [Thermodesulfobacteriota bacterium]
MIKKKVCMLGAFAVGKTSLVEQYVRSIFSEKYHTTVGVKIDKKQIFVKKTDMTIILWDIHGKDAFQDIRTSYLRGASGCIYVVDGTRAETLPVAQDLIQMVESEIGNVPYVIAFNKSDIFESWEIDPKVIDQYSNSGKIALRTSAKNNEGVEKAFFSLAERLLEY